jgi:hypothetical protein
MRIPFSAFVALDASSVIVAGNINAVYQQKQGDYYKLSKWTYNMTYTTSVPAALMGLDLATGHGRGWSLVRRNKYMNKYQDK